MADAGRLGSRGEPTLRSLSRSTIPVFLIASVLLAGCAGEDAGVPVGDRPDAAVPEAAAVLERESARIEARVAAIDSVFQPLPLLGPGDEAELRRFGNVEQLGRARALGVTGDRSPERLEGLVSEGSLVRLEDTAGWVVRDLDYSQPLVIPSVRELLLEIAERFQTRLASLDVPPLRMEITSVMRSAEDQVRLRMVNPNAAAGESTHEYGTTVDIAYNAFAAPSFSIVDIDTSDLPALRPHLVRFGDLAVERVAARRSKEIQAILGEVLVELQREGRVMVTLERQQPVYHMTVTR